LDWSEKKVSIDDRKSNVLFVLKKKNYSLLMERERGFSFANDFLVRNIHWKFINLNERKIRKIVEA
jgi:hypothetical protein